MSTTPDKQRKPSSLPPRPVAERERSFPVLSIAYRTFAQLEIWCMEGGRKEAEEYCNMFEWHEKQPRPIDGNLKWVTEMLGRGQSRETANQATIIELADKIFKECHVGVDAKETIHNPDPKRKFPFLTSLYHHYVIHGKDCAETQSVERLKEGVFRDLYCSHLIW